MPVERVQRNETSLAIQYSEKTSEDHGVIRGWIGAPELFDLSDTLNEGDWIIKANTGQVYRISNETKVTDFITVIREAGE